MQAAQRTFREDKKFKFLMLPEQSFYAVILVSFTFVSLVLSYRSMPMSAQHHREKWLQGGVSTHERYIRHDEMEAIFAAHREAVENTQKEIQKPAVFNAPERYTQAA